MVHIDNRMTRPLPPYAAKVLTTMFAGYQRVVVKKTFESGLSGSLVYLIRPIRNDGPELASIVKVDRVAQIDREWRAYRSFIQYKLPQVAEIRGEPVYPPGSPWGGLWYPLAGADTFAIESLHQYMQHASIEDIVYVLESQLFKSLGKLWLHSTVHPEFHVQSFYDSFLPVNLSIEVASPPPGAEVQWLDPQSVHRKTAVAGDYVQVSGFQVAKLSPESGRISLDIRDGETAAYRMHVLVPDVALYEVGQIIGEPLVGVVKQTRFDQLLSQARAVLGSGVDLTADTLALANGQTLPNPLVTLPSILNQTFDARVTAVHGDLNLENVLVEPENRTIHLIDFAKSRRDHVLRDFLHLEMAVVTRLIPKVQSASAVDVIHAIYKQLHCNILFPGQASSPLGMEKPYAILNVIRQTASQHLFEPDNWAEYYDGLVLYLLGALKFKDLDGLPTAPYPKQLAFWGAAVICQMLKHVPDCDEPPPPSPKINCFISHSQDDADYRFATKLSDALQSHGVKVWLDDDRELEDEKSAADHVVKETPTHNVFLFTISPTTVNCEKCVLELQEALRQRFQKGVQIIPLLLKTCPIPNPLQDLPYFDFRDETSFGKTLEKLLAGVNHAYLVHSAVAEVLDGDAETRSQGAQLLAKLQNRFSVPILARCLGDDSDPTVRYWLAYALGQIGGDEACAALQIAGSRETDLFAKLGIDEGIKAANCNNEAYSSKQITSAKLRQIIVASYSDSELRDLCFDLSVDYESLPGQGKSDKARELIAYFSRHGRYSDLVRICQKQRPNAFE